MYKCGGFSCFVFGRHEKLSCVHTVLAFPVQGSKYDSTCNHLIFDIGHVPHHGHACILAQLLQQSSPPRIDIFHLNACAVFHWLELTRQVQEDAIGPLSSTSKFPRHAYIQQALRDSKTSTSSTHPPAPPPRQPQAPDRRSACVRTAPAASGSRCLRELGRSGPCDVVSMRQSLRCGYWT